MDDETSPQPVAAIAEVIPSANYATPSNAPSEASPSSCGETFSTFTAGTLQSRWTTSPPQPPPAFRTSVVYDYATRKLPFEIDGHPQELERSHAPAPCPLPWLYEFLWTDGAILFAGDPLDIAKTRSRLSELGDATSGSSMKQPATTTTNVTGCRSADEMTCKSSQSRDSAALIEAVYHREENQLQLEERRAYLLEQLEAYWRSHPPQRSASRQKGKGPAQHQAEQRPSPRPASQPYTKKRPAGGRRRIGQGSGDGGEDDSEGDSAPAPTPSTSSTQDRWYACPYQKWRPQHYLFACGAGFKRVTDVKNHLLKEHFSITCPRCRGIYDDEDLLRLHFRKGCGRPRRNRPDGCFMSEQQRATINAPFNGRKMSLQEQWKFLFRTLFPNDPFPESVYLLPREEEIRNSFEKWASSGGGNQILSNIRRQALLAFPELTWNEPEASQLEAVMMQFITVKIQECRSEFQEYLSEKRLYADFATARQDFERSSSAAACVSVAANPPQALTAPGSFLTHDAVAQLTSGEWNPQPGPSIPLPMPTVGQHTGIPGCLHTNVDALGPATVCFNNSNLSNVSLGFDGDALNDRCALASRNGQRSSIPNLDGFGIPGIDLPGASAGAQWAGGYHLDEVFHLPSSYLVNGVAPRPSASAIVGINDYASPCTPWNPLVQSENWSLAHPFHHGPGPLRILNDGMTSGWPRAGGLQPISELPEL